MSFESVLGYKDNSLVYRYEDIFYNRLYWILKTFIQEEFFSTLDKESLKIFLLYPDISSLLISTSNKRNQEFESIILQEIKFYIDWDVTQSIILNEDKISGTNISLTTKDYNPDNGVVWHPDHNQEGMVWWWNKTPVEWKEVFSKSLDILKKIDENYFIELNKIIKKIVPMKTSFDIHNSCSYKDCIWTLYLWYTINAEFPELNILEALIHESSHNKLNLIMQSESLHENDFSLKYYSPYRPDARHIQWVFLWVHAIVPTVYVLLKWVEKGVIQEKSWYEKIVLFHVKNKLWYWVLSRHAALTTIWTKIFKDLWKVIALCDLMIKNNSKIQDMDFIEIQMRAKKHFIEAKNNNKYLQY